MKEFSDLRRHRLRVCKVAVTGDADAQLVQGMGFHGGLESSGEFTGFQFDTAGSVMLPYVP